MVYYLFGKFIKKLNSQATGYTITVKIVPFIETYVFSGFWKSAWGCKPNEHRIDVELNFYFFTQLKLE